jgi:hypothetical protein
LDIDSNIRGLSRFVTLGLDFYNELIEKLVVFRLPTLNLLRASSLSMDIYIWATYKNSYTTKQIPIPWDSLQLQFGSAYPSTPVGRKNFKRMFIASLKKVAIVYPDAEKIRPEKKYLWFVPGMPDIPKTYKTD